MIMQTFNQSKDTGFGQNMIVNTQFPNSYNSNSFKSNFNNQNLPMYSTNPHPSMHIHSSQGLTLYQIVFLIERF